MFMAIFHTIDLDIPLRKWASALGSHDLGPILPVDQSGHLLVGKVWGGGPFAP